VETFVNYELPTSRELQYLNDMGGWIFTKYAIRIQKTLYKMIRDNPKSVVALGLIEHMSGMNVVEPFDSHSVLFDIVPGHPGQYVDAMFAPLAKMFF
jgi:hypothetical protein